MSLVKKFDNRLRRKIALRAVWLPGTYISVGDILRNKNNAFVKVGNIKDYGVDYTESSIAKKQSINLQAQGVSYTVIQNQAKLDVKNLEVKMEAELDISFGKEDSYFIRTPNLSGSGLDKALMISKKVSQVLKWDFRKNYIVHNVWTADDFVFLGSTEKNTSVKFKGKGDAIKNLLDNGVSSNVSVQGQTKISFEVLGKSGPIVMQVFRVKSILAPIKCKHM